ncbi:MAG: pyridoxamine 5'-phosphate oxidase [Rhodospirillaceae bacterium]|nr:pyridoxamine 5'-phosphate oxidase [Rhodospirillaceae bacterium]
MTVHPWTEPFDLFDSWMKEAVAQEVNDPDAMNLATVDDRGHPTSRMVLLKAVDPKGFVFYTNLESRKGQNLAVNTHVALCFHWKSLRRQVRVEGPVEAVSEAEADAYFASRSRGSQIGAWASQQSRPLATRFELERRVAEFTAKFGLGKVPRPAHWSGFRVLPERIEFWKDKPFRLHDRSVFTRDGESWTVEKLFP